MHGDQSKWRRDGFESHEGMVGVLLADGSEPEPLVFDLGSGANFYESSSWWGYDGTLRRPTATSMRGRCACGWRGTKTYAIDWARVQEDDDPDTYDITGPYGDWEAHVDDVAARTVSLPEDLAQLLRQVREQVDLLWLEEDNALAGAMILKACGEMEALVAQAGPEAARLLSREPDSVVPVLAEGLGMTEKAVRSRLAHYEHLTWR